MPTPKKPAAKPETPKRGRPKKEKTMESLSIQLATATLYQVDSECVRRGHASRAETIRIAVEYWLKHAPE